ERFAPPENSETPKKSSELFHKLFKENAENGRVWALKTLWQCFPKHLPKDFSIDINMLSHKESDPDHYYYYFFSRSSSRRDAAYEANTEGPLSWAIDSGSPETVRL